MTVFLTGYLADLDKAYDFLSLTKSEFLQSYSYMTMEDYDSMLTEFKANEIEILAEYVRDAENMLIEENTYFDHDDQGHADYGNTVVEVLDNGRDRGQGNAGLQRIYQIALKTIVVLHEHRLEHYCHEERREVTQKVARRPLVEVVRVEGVVQAGKLRDDDEGGANNEQHAAQAEPIRRDL